jgi:hypothetical protein
MGAGSVRRELLVQDQFGKCRIAHDTGSYGASGGVERHGRHRNTNAITLLGSQLPFLLPISVTRLAPSQISI